MFEVQLGASVLVHATAGRCVVRILADAGVKAAGYEAGHVCAKLQGLIGPGGGRIDLVVGTHYDEDHLVGLVPIIKSTVEIGEAWLPPIVNEYALVPIDSPLDASDLLGEQLAGDSGREVLRSYLSAKISECSRIEAVESELLEHRRAALGERRHPDQDPEDRLPEETANLDVLGGDDLDLRSMVERLRGFVTDAEASLGRSRPGLLGDSPADPDDDDAVQELNSHGQLLLGLYEAVWAPALPPSTTRMLLDRATHGQDESEAESRLISLAYLKRATGRGAINAAALAAVISALTERQVPIRYVPIDAGRPRTFVWDRARRRFWPSASSADAPSTSPSITVLAPSRTLIKKHRHRLPIAEAINLALFSSIPIKSITPSNQLSYALRIDNDGQRILIAGDTGFVDFAVSRGAYDPRLLAELRDLDIVQVAHHGGNNAHFYPVLLDAGIQHGDRTLHLLLSHATNDRHRPSSTFGDFVDQIRGSRNVKVLFTSKPAASKVNMYRALVAPLAPSGRSPQDVGDITLTCEASGVWDVQSHAVEV